MWHVNSWRLVMLALVTLEILTNCLAYSWVSLLTRFWLLGLLSLTFPPRAYGGQTVTLLMLPTTQRLAAGAVHS